MGEAIRMAITYNAGLNTITVTGYTEAVPCTFLDVYNADVAGGWGVVSRLDVVNGWKLDCDIYIGNNTNTTWFKSENEYVVIKPTNNTYWGIVAVTKYATLKIGTLDTNNRPDKGSYWFVDCSLRTTPTHVFCYLDYYTLAAYQGEIYIYDSMFQVEKPPADYVLLMPFKTKMKRCTFKDDSMIRFYSADSELENIVLHSCTQDNSMLQSLVSPSYTWSNLSIYSANRGILLFQVFPTTIKNVVMRNCTYGFWLYQISVNSYIINGDIDNWSLLWLAPSTGLLYRQYEFSLKVIQDDSSRTPISGARVKIWDKDNVLVANVMTDGFGNISTQTLNYGYYDMGHGNTAQMKTPHKMLVTKPGFKTELKYMYMDYKRKETVVMRIVQAVKICDNDLILQIAPESTGADENIFTKI